MSTNDYTLEVPLKRCTKCSEEYPATLEYFPPRKQNKNGLYSHCRACKREAMRQRDAKNPGRGQRYYQANKEKMQQWSRDYAATHRDEAKERSRKWREDNPEKAKETAARYRAQNSERIKLAKRHYYIKNIDTEHKKRRKWRLANTDIIKEHNRKWYAENAEYAKSYRRQYYLKNRDAFRTRNLIWQRANRDKTRAASQRHYRKYPEKYRAQYANYRARKMKAPGRYTDEDVQRQYEYQNGRCHWCGVKLNGKYHVDHIKALVKGGSNYPENICCSCADCNLSKGGKDLQEWGRLF